MDALLQDLQIVCSELLPIVGTVALIFLCILLKKCWKLIEQFFSISIKGATFFAPLICWCCGSSFRKSSFGVGIASGLLYLF